MHSFRKMTILISLHTFRQLKLHLKVISIPYIIPQKHWHTSIFVAYHVTIEGMQASNPNKL